MKLTTGDMRKIWQAMEALDLLKDDPMAVEAKKLLEKILERINAG